MAHSKAACEFENSTDPNLVAYSLWKVLCVHCGLRVVYYYRPNPAATPAFVAALAAASSCNAHDRARDTWWLDHSYRGVSQ